jgi:hypothetical protein
LVEACVRSYGEEFSPGYWRLRAGEAEENQEVWAAQGILLLGKLGQRMGYRVRGTADADEIRDYDVTWLDDGQIAHGFLLQWHARMAAVLLRPWVASRAEHQYYVLPRARAPLVQARMAHDRRLHGAMLRGDWKFLKDDSLRSLAGAKEVARHDLRRIVGLDPIIEQEEAQIPLF